MLGLACLVFSLALAGGGLAKSEYRTQVGWIQDQPVPFSHQHHAGELGIDCRYCHSGVETGEMAGLPPTHTCMTCHSQIWDQCRRPRAGPPELRHRHTASLEARGAIA